MGISFFFFFPDGYIFSFHLCLALLFFSEPPQTTILPFFKTIALTIWTFAGKVMSLVFFFFLFFINLVFN